VNKDLIEMIKRHEGCVKNSAGRHVLYLCPANKWTCGWGRNAEANGFSEDEVELMLQNDIKYAINILQTIFVNYSNFSENRQNALIDLMFNIGSKKFLLFRKMITAIKKDDWEEAAIEAKNSNWHTQVGIRAVEIEELLKNG